MTTESTEAHFLQQIRLVICQNTGWTRHSVALGLTQGIDIQATYNVYGADFADDVSTRSAKSAQ